jgi:exodeoxyribonuclease VII small subunit
MQNTKSIENMSFEEALSELEQIVRKLDSGQENLESSIQSYERASQLKSHCEKKLEEAKFKIEKVSKTADGAIKITE